MNNNKILIVVDMQRGFITNKTKFLISKINSIIPLYDKVYFTKFINSKNSMFVQHINWRKLSQAEEQKIIVDIPQNATIFKKYTYGLSIKDINKLKEEEITEVDICGLKTDACVYAIALQLFDNGIFPNILINYVSSKFSKNILEDILLTQFGKVNRKK